MHKWWLNKCVKFCVEIPSGCWENRKRCSGATLFCHTRYVCFWMCINPIAIIWNWKQTTVWSWLYNCTLVDYRYADYRNINARDQQLWIMMLMVHIVVSRTCATAQCMLPHNLTRIQELGDCKPPQRQPLICSISGPLTRIILDCCRIHDEQPLPLLISQW